MNENEIRRARRRARAALVAEFMFKQRLERIDWEEEVMNPALEEIDRQIGNGELPVIELAEEGGA